MNSWIGCGSIRDQSDRRFDRLTLHMSRARMDGERTEPVGFICWLDR